MKIATIKVSELIIHEHHLEILYSADNFKFSTKVFYHDISFSSLKEKYSQQTVGELAAYIALFEGMKLCSLFPKYYDVSAIADRLAEPVVELFANIYNGVFSQHLYENNVTDYSGPEIIYPGTRLGSGKPTRIKCDDSKVLAACGGGKDSIVAMKMLQEAEIPLGASQFCKNIIEKALHLSKHSAKKEFYSRSPFSIVPQFF